ncbi:auxilin-like protein 1 [Olea europaea var. sylvestris]|uniref:auxilin-like protein 1 n=1 Tax=Olea europaea var. sylvestris TaxID=158386 RepID=UPI000C1D3D77|nr:auxilin-like protein 1 [Olea europaea var. sylvestris]
MESLSRPPHRRKHSTSTANAFSSFSSKNPYDDVLLSSGGGGRGSLGTKLGVQEYAEIFSGSQRESSIPVLDLSGLEERAGSGDFRSSKLDYSNIFGGFRDEDVAVPYEQLFAGGKIRKTSSDKPRTPANKGSPLRESHRLNSSGNNEGFPVEALDKSIDSTKQQFNLSFNKSGQQSSDGSNGKMHVAELHAVPGFTSFVDGTAHLHKTEGNRPAPSLKREVSRAWSFSAEVEQNHGGKSEAHILNNQISDSAVRGKVESSLDESHITDKPLNKEKINFKSHDSKVLPPSSFQSNLNEQKAHRRTRSSSFGSKADASENIDGDSSLPFFDEELDVNSVAAASAAVLKKAIEQAQESIRIAKEIMERRRECFRDGSKPSPRGRLKLKKDKKEKRIVPDTNISKENNAPTKTYESLDSVLPAFEADRKFAPSAGQKELIFNAGKIDEDKIQENVEVAEEYAGARSSPGLKINAEGKTLTLGSVQMNNSNNSVRSMNELVSDIKEIETVEEILDQTEVVFDLKGGQANVDEHGNSSRVLDASQRVPELEEIVDKAGEHPIISKDDAEIEEKRNIFDENGKCTEKVEAHQEIGNGELPKLQKLVFDNPLNETRNPTEKEKEKEEDPRQEQMEKKVGSVSNWKEKYHQPGKSYEEEEIASRKEDPNSWFGTEEEPKEALEKEIEEREQKVFQEAGAVEKRLGGDNEPDIDEKKPNCAHDGDELEIRGEHEREVIGERHAENSENETTEMRQMNENKYAEDQKIAASLEAEEMNSTLGGTGKREDNHDIYDFQEAILEKNFDASVDACDSGSSTIVTQFQEACTVELNDNSVDENQREVESEKEKGSTTRVTETSSSIEKNEKQEPVEEAFQQEDNEMLKAASLIRSASEMNFVGSKLHNAFEDLSSDGITENSSDTDVSNEEKLPKYGDAFRTSDQIHNAAQEENANGNYMQDFTEFHASGEKTTELDLTDVKVPVEQTSEIDEGSDSISSLEKIDELSDHETQTFAESVKDEAFSKEEGTDDLEMTCNEVQYVEEQNEGESSVPSEAKQNEESLETESGMKTGQNDENKFSTVEDGDAKENVPEVQKKDCQQRIEAIKRKREQEKERIAVERAIREARERAFAEARERAERAALERAAAEARQRAMAEAREKLGKASASTKQSADKAISESKLRTERAAVERATAEARERALEKAFSQKTPNEAKTQADKFSGVSRNNALKHSYSSSDLEKFDGNNNESAQRRKARLERHQRIMERAAKALAEKNMRDLLAQKEQAERNRLAESLDADIKRWATGKEGNLRALLSTLQYILGPDSGWQPIPLTEIVTTPAVKKAYRKATLYVHPDKLQQKGASIQQKYICEKVFDLLKAAWNRFNSEER